MVQAAHNAPKSLDGVEYLGTRSRDGYAKTRGREQGRALLVTKLWCQKERRMGKSVAHYGGTLGTPAVLVEVERGSVYQGEYKSA